ncbi:hypothetical protein PYW07_005519 [Mythimna separata]|uniref:Acyltransferase 3 domain-containing protein n=1 Tax=Mythimna separata TaxID=271217 RepID=A0AAD7YJ17_MYTSE|nr:hypothetical protein PYW07_005519 [Mythimna separata]
MLFFILLFHICCGVTYELNASEYSRMPPIFYLDDYDRCLQEANGLFCTFNADLISDKPSNLLTMIKEYSMQEMIHFNHSRLHYGLCVTKTCKKQYELSLDLRQVLEGCLNETIWEKYELKVKVTNKYHCNMPKQYGHVDALDIFVAISLLIILMLNLIGSLCDAFRGTNDKNSDKSMLHYFSIRQNWRILWPLGEESDPRLRRLKGFHGIKAITMLFLINAHGAMPYITFVNNTQFVENSYSDLIIYPFMNGALVTRTYVIVSAFLLTYSLQLFSEKNPINWSILPKWILMRIIRLTPTYAVVLAWSMTWARFLGDGPHWHRAAVIESEHCRRDWWRHLLYINNYINGSHCNIPAWYLAADTQLYCLALVILISSRSTRARKLVLSMLFIIGLIIPAAHIYFEDLQPFPITSPNNILNFFTTDPTFNSIYKRGHANVLNCVFGIALGLSVYHCQKNKFNVQKYTRYRIVYWSLPVLSMALVTSGCIFFTEGPKVSLVTRMLFSIVVMPLLSLVLTAIFWGVVMKFEDVYRGILEWPGWVTPARLSYCAYLLHGTLIRLLAGSATELTHASLPNCLYSDVFNFPFLNGTLVTRTYVIVSAFLLTYSLQLFSEKNSINWSILPKWILMRIIRLTPTYAVVLAWSMTWARFLGEGPHWHRAAVIESEHCRRDWWRHLLYINNYINGSHCNIPAWYLAADTQLYCLALVILISCHSTRSRKLVLSTLFIIGLIIPAAHIYFEDLQPFPITSPNNILNFFTTDPTFNSIYKRGHANVLNCVFGIALGLTVYHCQKNKLDVQKYKRYRIIYWSLPVLSMALVTSGCIFFTDGPKVSLVTRMLFSIVVMPLLSLVLTVIFWGVVMKFEDVYRGILEWPGWVTPARLSYCAYLLHGTLIRLVAGSATELTHASLPNCFKYGLLTIVLAYTAATPLFLMVEAPFMRLLKERVMSREHSDKKKRY